MKYQSLVARSSRAAIGVISAVALTLGVARSSVAMANPATLGSGQTTAPYPWCHNFLEMAPPNRSPVSGILEVAELYDSEIALCRGQFVDAEREFNTIVPYWHAHQNDDSHWIETAEGYYFALVALRKDSSARHFLTQLEVENAWKASAADHLLWEKHVPAAIAEYASEAEGFEFDGPPDPIIKGGADAAKAGRFDDAVRIWSQPPDDGGPSSNPTLQLLLVGNVEAAEGKWAQAFTAWYDAASNGHEVPESDFLDRWNLSALEMTWYYRNHDPRRQ